MTDNAEHVRALESIKTMCAHILSDEGRDALTAAIAAAIAALDRAAVEANRGEDDCVMSGCPERIGMISHHSATDHYVFSINGEVYALERGEFEGMVLLLYTLNRADAELQAALDAQAGMVCVGVKEMRRAVAAYMFSEGCTCCRDVDAHIKNESRLAELLNVPKLPDDSGFDFEQFRTAGPVEGGGNG